MGINVLDALIYNENSLTRLLVALCRLKPIREHIMRKFTNGEFGADDIDFTDIEDQARLINVIPDIQIKTSKVNILVEIKTSPDCYLQNSQPTQYLNYLENQKNVNKDLKCFFIFLTPPKYNYKESYRKRCEPFKLNRRICFIELNWIELAEILKESGLSEASPYAQDFYNALRARFMPQKITFKTGELETKTMFSIDAAQAHHKIFSLIEGVREAYEMDGILVDKKYEREWWNHDEYGFFIKRNGDYILWFGLWMAYWQETGNPLCFGVRDCWKPDAREMFKKNFPLSKEFREFAVTNVQPHWLTTDAVEETRTALKPYLADVAPEIFGK